jgi:hypothetical protein
MEELELLPLVHCILLLLGQWRTCRQNSALQRSKTKRSLITHDFLDGYQAMEPLHRLFKKAQDIGLLDRVSKNYEKFRVSLYADTVALFIKPSRHDL